MMFKKMMSSVLFVGLMAVSVTSNATLLVNHHNEPYREYTRHVTQQRAFPKASRSHQHSRSYSQHSKNLVNRCLRLKNGKNYRVC
jgi:hypothetical protein